MRCGKCGADHPDDAKFCLKCGEKLKDMEAGCYCPFCGQINSTDSVFCASCGRSMDVSIQETLEKRKRHRKKKRPVSIIIGGIVIAVAVVAITIVGIKLSSREKGIKAEECVYLRDGSFYTINANKKEKVSKRLVGEADEDIDLYDDDLYDEMVTISADGQYLFYPSNISEYYGEGYRLNVIRLGDKKSEEIKIDNNVLSYELLDNQRLLFKDEEDTLYVSDFEGNKEKVASDVGTYWVNSDRNLIVWQNIHENEEESVNLYFRNLELKTPKEKLASKVQWKGNSSDFERIYVTDEKSNLYVIRNFNKKEKIDTNIGDFFYVNSDMIFYTKEKIVTADSIIEDDRKVSDRAMEVPEEEDYYKEILEKNAYSGEFEKVPEFDGESYDKAWNEYREKEARDEIRDEMKEYIIEDFSSELYCYDGKSSSLIDDNYGNYLYTTKNGIIYLRYNWKEMKKVKLSQLSSLDDLKFKHEEICKKSMETCLYNNGEQTVLSETIDLCKVDADKDKAYGLAYNTGILYSFSIAEDADGKMKQIADDVESIELAKDGDIYYTAGKGDYGGDLYCNEKIIDSDVESGSLKCFDGKVYYHTDSGGNIYTLRCYNGEKAKTIADDVVCEKSADNLHIFLISDYDMEEGVGNLLFYDGESTQKVVDDVVWFWIRGKI